MIVCSAVGPAEPLTCCAARSKELDTFIFKKFVRLFALPYCRKEVILCIQDRDGQRFIFANRLFTSLMFFFGGGGPVF